MLSNSCVIPNTFDRKHNGDQFILFHIDLWQVVDASCIIVLLRWWYYMARLNEHGTFLPTA